MAPSNGLPKHVCIIMDGNGRWAKARDKQRIQGHYEGALRVDEIVTEARRLGIRYLTLYTFSTENWDRPKAEVTLLMELLVKKLRTLDQKLLNNQVGLRAQGDLSRLSSRVRKELDRVIQLTNTNETQMILSLALSYGGRQEIVDTARTLATKVAQGELTPDQIDERLFQDHLYAPDIPDPDLFIRTGGDQRISNFLLWELAYTELYLTQTPWPEFNAKAFHQALEAFSQRQRRYGKTGEQLQPQAPT